jgi:hypothetical protein
MFSSSVFNQFTSQPEIVRYPANRRTKDQDASFLRISGAYRKLRLRSRFPRPLSSFVTIVDLDYSRCQKVEGILTVVKYLEQTQ